MTQVQVKPNDHPTPQFKMPPPYRFWCHVCPDGGRGFMSIDEGREHFHKVHGGYRV